MTHQVRSAVPAFASGGIDGRQAFGTFGAAIGKGQKYKPADGAKESSPDEAAENLALFAARGRADGRPGYYPDNPGVIGEPFDDTI